MWTVEHSIVTNASPAAISRLFADVATWPEWNKGIEWVTLDGPFAAGTHGQMKVPGQEPFAFRLLAVGPDGFEDETPIPDAGVVVRVRHAIETSAGRTRVAYGVTIDGPQADALGPVLGPEITADFPAVLEALVARAEALAAPV